MKEPYFFCANNMGGCVIGLSDWGFSLVVYADDQNEAEEWGLHIARLYCDRFGFPPHGIHPPHDEIKWNCSVDVFPEFDPEEGIHLVCVAGELPNELNAQL